MSEMIQCDKCKKLMYEDSRSDKDAYCITQERTERILCDYIANDLDSADPGYVREVLRDVCGVTTEEAKALGISELFDIEEE